MFRPPPLQATMITVGIGSRNYNYQRMVYGLPVQGTRFAKGIYVPWKFLRKDPLLENTYAFLPYPRFDIYHLWNGILLNRRPFITSFESYLPRVFHGRRDLHYRAAMGRLRSPDCRRLLAMSNFARRFFCWQNKDEVDDALAGKIEVFAGGVSVPEHAIEHRLEALAAAGRGPFRCCFVGHEFFRKGGYPVVRAFARLAQSHRDVRLVVVSRLLANDYASREPHERTAEMRDMLRTASWVEWHESLPHAEVLRLMTTCRLGLLPTLDDTFGWSTLEAMSYGLPVISTNICALPEIVHDGHNGCLIPLACEDNGRWSGLALPAGSTAATAARAAAYRCIEDGVFDAVSRLIESPDDVVRMSRNAVAYVQERHDPIRRGQRLAAIYREAVAA